MVHEADPLLEYKKMRDDPFYFASHCVFTEDQIDRDNPIKPFPKDLDYLRLYFKVWQKERLIVVPKSRRMFFTWGTIVLYLWDAIFHKGRQIAIISKKESDADELLDRCVFILNHIPKGILPAGCIPKWKKTYCRLEFPDLGSRIMAFPSGSDQLRQFAFSGVFADEMAFWDDAREMYSSTFPTIENLGQMTAVSSPAPGFFKELVTDQLDDRPIPPDADTKHRFPIEGIEIWKNPKNRFLVFQVHYTANPVKRDPKYIEQIKAAMPISQFNREFMLIWETYDGKPVYPDFNSQDHVSQKTMDPWPGLPLLIGVDFGLTPSAVICQLQGHQLVVLDEVVEVNMGAERFAQVLGNRLMNRYPGWRDFKKNIVMFCDPAGFQRSQSDETTCMQKLGAAGFMPEPGDQTWEARRTSVERFLVGRHKDGPDFILDATNCPMLNTGFKGGYHFPEKAFEKEPDKIRPLKNEYSHVHDALQYLCSGIVKRRNHNIVKVPNPQYSFNRETTWNQ